jgi:hypothetical protein
MGKVSLILSGFIVGCHGCLGNEQTPYRLRTLTVYQRNKVLGNP